MCTGNRLLIITFHPYTNMGENNPLKAEVLTLTSQSIMSDVKKCPMFYGSDCEGI